MVVVGLRWLPMPTSTGWVRARVLDVEGYEWSFGTYEPGAEW